MKFEFDTQKKHFHGRNLNKHDNMDGQIDALFGIINPDILNRPYQKVLNHLLRFYKGTTQAFEHYINISKPISEDLADNPDILPANGHDICNYFARYRLANYQIQAVMKMDGRINYNKLVRAVRISVDAEPVLGCRFIEHDPPYWKRLNNIDEIDFCSFEGTNDLDKAIQEFLESTLDMDKDPMVKVKLIRSRIYDTLCIKMNHVCCDGAGVKEYIQLLSVIYSAIDQENGDFIPRSRIGGRKDQDRLFKALGIKNPEARYNPSKIVQKTGWTFHWNHGETNATQFEVLRLPVGQLEILTKYGKARGATINDLILTAYYRALFNISQPSPGIPMDISTTIDLRRYLPDQKAEAIRNFSGGFMSRLARVKDESFEETLSRVTRMIKKIKKGYPGLQSAMGAEWVEKMSFTHLNAYFKDAAKNSAIKAQLPKSRSRLCFPTLSNLLFISKALLKFGENTVTDAYIVGPAVRAPGFLLLVGSYNGILTMTTGVYKAEIDRKNVESLLNKIKDELMQACE